MGLVESVIVVVRGITSTYVSSVRPAGSTTERWIRYQTLAEVSPNDGIVIEPLVSPLVGCRNGWKCVSWWKLTHQVKAEAGKAPVSGSLALPA